MNHTYFALVKHDEYGIINDISVPDLGLHFTGDQLDSLNVLGLNRFVEIKIVERIEAMQKQAMDLPLPKNIEQLHEQLRTTNLAKDDFWIGVNVSIQQKKGFFARILPWIGSTATVAAYTSGTIISIVALELSLKNIDNKNLARAFSITQAVNSNLLVGSTIYFTSKATDGLTQLGLSLDLRLRRAIRGKPALENHVKPAHPKPERNCGDSTKIIMIRTALSTIVVGNLISNIMSNESSLSALEIQSAENNSIIPENIFDVAKWLAITTGGISGLIFVASCFYELSKRLEHYLAHTHTSPTLERNGVRLALLRFFL